LVYPCAKHQSSTNKEDSGIKSVIAFPYDRIQLGEFVKAIAFGGTSTFQSLLDDARRHASQVLSKILNEGIKDAA
jgi:hypothetical protein